MSRKLLDEALSSGARHVSPFLVLGDPTPEASVELAKAAVDLGATMLELGLPYSDPSADGPSIQAADVRSLTAGTRPTSALKLLAAIRAFCPSTPLNLLVYGNLVHARGFARFCGEAAEAGASSLLVPDIPLEEGELLRRAATGAGLANVLMLGPLTRGGRLRMLDRACDGFLYLVAHQGVTGVRRRADSALPALVRRTVRTAIQPVAVGFGLSRREEIDAAFAAGARIAVVGSHLADAIGRAWSGDGGSLEARVVEGFRAALGPLLLPASTPSP